MPLSVIREGSATGGPWLPSDRLLAVALTLYEADTCPGCGHSKTDAWGEHAHSFEREQVLCNGCAAIESRKDDDRQPGEKIFAVDEANSSANPGEVAPTFD